MYLSSNACTDEPTKSRLPRNAIYYNSLQNYTSLLRQQNHILDDRTDLAVLRAGLKQMPKLKRVSVLDQFQSRFNRPLHWDLMGLSWYETWSAKLCEGVPQSTRSLAMEYTWAEIHVSCDSRGIESLLVAISECAPQLQQLDLSCPLPYLSINMNGIRRLAEFYA